MFTVVIKKIVTFQIVEIIDLFVMIEEQSRLFLSVVSCLQSVMTVSQLCGRPSLRQ